MKKTLLILLLFINSKLLSVAIHKDIDIYIWNRSNTTLKEVKIDIKNVIPGRGAGDLKSSDITSNSVKKIGIVNKNSDKYNFGKYIDEIDLKYEISGSAQNDDYHFNANISLGDEELERILLVTDDNDFNESESNKRDEYGHLHIYKFYRDQVKADLARFLPNPYSKYSEDSHKNISIGNGYISIDNNIDYSTANNNTPPAISNTLFKYDPRIIKSERKD